MGLDLADITAHRFAKGLLKCRKFLILSFRNDFDTAVRKIADKSRDIKSSCNPHRRIAKSHPLPMPGI